MNQKYIFSADGTLLRRCTIAMGQVPHFAPFALGGQSDRPTNVGPVDDHIGPLTYHNGTLKRIDTPNGFISDDEIYYYVKDYQGNIRQVTDADGTVLQDNHYYPYGMLMAESSDILSANRRSMPSLMSPSSPATVAVSNPYLFGGKEYLTFKGANYLDYSARIYDNTTLTFGSPDPLRDDCTNIHAHLYCTGNPVMFIDPTGCYVVADLQSQDNIRHTLTEYEASFVRFDDNGKLDNDYLKECQSNSENYSSLLLLSESEIEYNFMVTDKTSNGTRFFGNNNDSEHLTGMTEMPNAENYPSLQNSKVNILVYSGLPKNQQIITTAHEAYGHAAIYEITGDPFESSHQFDPGGCIERMGADGNIEYIVIWKAINTILEQRIQRVEAEAFNNSQRIFKK